ncbi:MAG: hypothetical protein LiPW15_567 [Parcubacteria group bacterium LiPW_15]|nr:MAG: hypothetical protein LiPW15_567 [Parcubacteria group bacterium LiPW_15]
MFAPSAHAAVSIERVDQPTRALLGQTLNVLDSVLNDIQARLNGAGSPIENPATVSVTLGGIKQVLVSVSAELSASPVNSPIPIESQQAAQPVGFLDGSGASVVSSDKETASASSVLSPKLLFVLLPILLLILVAVSLFRKKDRVEIKDSEIVSAVAPIAAQESNNEIQTV